MLRFPEGLSPHLFLRQFWQQKPLPLRRAVDKLCPALSRNELAWLATLEDAESRIVFTDRRTEGTRYRVETGPFTESQLENLPKRDWTLLVHDVEKHLPRMRRLFDLVAFIPEWRIEDLMVSFAAPGGGVGPHRDNYDVFLCQGIGVRRWRYSDAPIAEDARASEQLKLLQEFADGECLDASNGDILYLPPGIAHWGTATRAAMTYSIGMRAPTLTELAFAAGVRAPETPEFFTDQAPSLAASEPALIPESAIRRAMQLLNCADATAVAIALGTTATQTKDWLTPEVADAAFVDAVLRSPRTLNAHGMARLAYDQQRIYCNGFQMDLSTELRPYIKLLCNERRLSGATVREVLIVEYGRDFLRWLLEHGAIDPGNM